MSFTEIWKIFIIVDFVYLKKQIEQFIFLNFTINDTTQTTKAFFV